MKKLLLNAILMSISIVFGYLAAVGTLIQAQNISAYWGHSLNDSMVWGWQFGLLVFGALIFSSVVMTLLQSVVSAFTDTDEILKDMSAMKPKK